MDDYGVLQELPRNIANAEPGNRAASKKGAKSVETVYQKKTQLEHILLRPDTYIGSVEFVTELMWIYDTEAEKIVQKEISYVPGLYKIYDEILVNAADNKQRDPKMDTIKIDIDSTNNQISVFNNGRGIPVAMHKDEKMYVPTMIFGHLLTSSNYNDEEQKVTGGRNGYGAKLCNIFSEKFVVETSSHEYKKAFKQTWGKNMSKASEAKVKDSFGTDFTKVTFSPDLSKFKMTSLDQDIVALMSRRAYDIAASSRGVKVFLNGKKITVKNFKDYVDLYLKDRVDDADNPVKAVYENANERWEVAAAISEKGFQQMSFVNSIATTKGGRHVEYVTDMIVKNITEGLKKKNKSGVQIKPFQIKNHLWIFVNCLIVNPTFDSQTKENMTLQVKSFGSKCALSEKFINGVMKCGIVEAVLTWAKFKQQAQLQSKCAGSKRNKIRGIAKLEDANDAGTKFSSQCTLILTEGDSAKTLAVAGLGVVGRDRYGVFPLKGKLLNVREATHKQILENAEINNIIKIIGLQYKKRYDSDDDMKSLRYGKMMIMADQDQDGSHIKGLVINFIHHNWPTLIRRKFVEEFITPIIKATKGKEELSFYSLPEFEEWKKSKDNWPSYRVKYYKGLGTSTSKEAKEYFNDMVRHRISFTYGGTQDDHSIQLAFSRKAIDQRKEWLTSWMEECKRRKELGLPDIYLYEKDTSSVTYSDFINKELVLFSNLDNERSIPSLVDGLKPGQRKVLYTCLKRNDKREVKVAQLAGSVAEHSAYHHGEASLMSTIINLAQNYIGSNNINLLQPIGQFGTRLLGGKDSASPRYIFTMLSKLTKLIFHPHDTPLLKNNFEDSQKIEPEVYIPIIPMVLVNGAEGIGTGWSTKVPNYNPREIVANLKKMIRGEEPKPMKPWFKNFRGTIDNLDHQRYLVHGEIAELGNNKLEITELPIRVWTQSYKESVMEAMLTGTDKSPAVITEFKEYNTDTTVRFVVTLTEDNFRKAYNETFHKFFKLQSSMATSCMVLFDSNGVLRKYECVMEILREFFELRLKFYVKRKGYLVGMLDAEVQKLSNQARFILEKCDGRLVIENKKKKEMLAELQRKGFDSDPVKAWKMTQDNDSTTEEEKEEGSDEEQEEDTDSQGPDYDYLLGMKMWCLTKERKDEILKQRDQKTQELKLLKDKSPEDLWNDDLDAFMTELDAVEKEERENEQSTMGKKAGGAKKGTKKNATVSFDTKPSTTAVRIVPQVDFEVKRRAEKATAAKENKAKKVKKEAAVVETDMFDEIVSANTGKSLAARLGNSPDAIAKNARTKKPAGEKQTKKGTPKKKKKNTWNSDASSPDEDNSDGDDEREVTPRQRPVSRRSAANKVKYSFEEEEEGISDGSLHDNVGIEEPDMFASQSLMEDTMDDPQQTTLDVSDTDSEFGVKPQPKPKAKLEELPELAAVSPEKPSASDLFDSMMTGSSTSQSSEPTSKPKPKKRNVLIVSSDEDEPQPKKKSRPKPKASAAVSLDSDSDPKPKKKPATKKAAPKPKAKVKSDSESGEFSFDIEEDFKEKKKPQKKTMVYAISDSDQDFDDY
ncbi:hypothetical protein Pmani_016723 [Petrolisthes manimaculis]|uniref:DNA topoisomerase 2 n=1 Tax=Petrolisthes manimaculis TaxID=1843537 RepID=A0AAE1PP50_9EUCA|nr:hypothetical protein Pmani_016723 [Petrolisthes manimaculis]